MRAAVNTVSQPAVARGRTAPPACRVNLLVHRTYEVSDSTLDFPRLASTYLLRLRNERIRVIYTY